MNSSRKKSIGLHLACVFLVLLIACTRERSNPERSSSKPQVEKLSELAAEVLLVRAPVELWGPKPQALGKQVVFVLGENHASVKAQKNLYETLKLLSSAQKLDAILVEGSSGQFDRDSVAKAVGEGSPAFWDSQLESGAIAGYELFALQKPEVRIEGVENMDAKMRFATNMSLGFKEARQRAMIEEQHAHALLEDALKALPGGGSESARRDVQAHSLAISNTDKANQIIEQQLEPMRVLEQERVELLEKNREVIKELMALAGLTGAKQEAELKRATDKFGETKVILALDALKRLSSLHAQLEKLAKPLKGVGSSSTRNATRESYFRAANAVAKEAGSRKGEPVFRAVQTRYMDDARRAEAATSTSRDELRERDVGMATATKSYFQSNDAHYVAIVVGFAHLEGITAELSSRGLTPIAAVVRGSKDLTEPWEVAAWERRQALSNRWAQAFEKSGTNLKELSAFTSEDWKRGASAMSRLSREISEGKPPLAISSLPEVGQAYRLDPKTDVVAIVDQGAYDGHLAYGAEVLAQGRINATGTQVLTIVDREAARSAVKKHATPDIGVAYLFRSEDGAHFYTPNGEVPFKTLTTNPKSAAIGQQPKAVIFAGEFERDGRGRELLFEKLLRESGLGGGRPPGTPPSGGEPPGVVPPRRDPKAPLPFRSRNVERAKANVALLLAQRKVPRTDRPVVLDLADVPLKQMQEAFDGLRFTGQGGEFGDLVIVLAKNVEEFRGALTEAGFAKKLENKRVALVTCADAYGHTDALVEHLLQNGAIEVWRPESLLSPDAARKLAAHIENVAGSGAKRGSMQELVIDAIARWEADARRSGKGDPDLGFFKTVPASWVHRWTGPGLMRWT